MLARVEWGWLAMVRARWCAIFALLTACGGDADARRDACASVTDEALELEFEADIQGQHCGSECRLRMRDLAVLPDGSAWVIADVTHASALAGRDFVLLARYGTDGSLLASAKVASSSESFTVVAVDVASDAAGNALVAWQVRSNFTSTGDWDEELWVGRWDDDGHAVRAPAAYPAAALALLQAGPDDSTILAGTVQGGGPAFVAKLDGQQRQQWRIENLAERVFGFGISALVVDDAGQSTVMAQRGEPNGSSFYLWRVASDGSLAWERLVTSEHDVSSRGTLLSDAAGNLTAALYTRNDHGHEALIQRFDANGELHWSHTLVGIGGWHAPPLTVDRTSGRVFAMTSEKLDERTFEAPALSTLSSEGQRCDGYEYARPSDYEVVSMARGRGTDLYMLLSQGLVRYSGLRP
jgi:hypothetical protein